MNSEEKPQLNPTNNNNVTNISGNINNIINGVDLETHAKTLVENRTDKTTEDGLLLVL